MNMKLAKFGSPSEGLFYDDSPFICREHLFQTTNQYLFEKHLIEADHWAVFSCEGVCQFCGRHNLYFHNVRYIGLPVMFDLICEQCAPAQQRKANAYRDPAEALKHKRTE